MGSLTILLASLRQSRKMSSTDRFYINCAGFINKYNHLPRKSHKEDYCPHSQHQQDQQGHRHVFASRFLLQLIGLGDVFPGCVGIAVGGEYFLSDDVQLLALFMHKHSGFLNDVMHVHDAFGHDVDLMVPFVHQLTLHLELDLLLLLTLGVSIVVGHLALLVGETAPSRDMALWRFRLLYDRFHRWQFPVLSILAICVSLFVMCRCEELIPAIPLNSKLLLGGANFSGSIGVKVRLFEPLNEFFNACSCILNDWLLSLESGSDDGAGVNPNGSVEMVVAVLELFYEGDGLLVGRTELPSHYQYIVNLLMLGSISGGKWAKQ